ncbi:MAG TPA: phosphoenolpyruvate--protein phosphotransferase, partial [Bacteroidales bacterium]|nr:phosphoenolpyruvate--protein phosphotransferase [Bacteroidales bacterium]
DQGQIDEYLHKQKLFREKRLLLESIKDLPSKTTDGHMVKVYANISAPDDLEQVYENGGEGIGLLRTEMLFMGRDSFPSEEEQFQFYRLVAIKSKNLPVIIRTIDIGGDKQLNYFGIPVENNPFLGYRAIRICLDRKDIFMPQLRAILRASAFGTLKIMFPMICNVDEVIQAKECVRQAKNDLTDSGIKFDSDIELGIMIEIPSAALTADILAREVDFFSIGTNDLCQYTMAVDRMNDSVSMLYNHFNPGVLRLIQKVIEEAHKQGKQVGMCGEMASDPLATLLLLGMGLDEFSMSPASIPVIKNIIINHTLTEAGDILGRVMDMDNPDSITSYLQEVLK